MSKNDFYKALYGLRTNTTIKIRYNVESNKITEIIGLSNIDPDKIEISELLGFNIPQFISVLGIPYYPSKYEFSQGDIWYHSHQPPIYQIHIPNRSLLGERAKIMNARITPAQLSEYDKPCSLRPRQPNQASVMGESASNHVKKLIDKGILVVPEQSVVVWHWCHLIAFTMLPSNRAQTKRNLFVGSHACNGHMANIETAVKAFIFETKRPVSLEVTVTTAQESQLGLRIRYQIYEQKSQTLHREYFDALTETLSDYADYEIIYKKLMEKFYSRTTSRSK